MFGGGSNSNTKDDSLTTLIKPSGLSLVWSQPEICYYYEEELAKTTKSDIVNVIANANSKSGTVTKTIS